MVKILVCDDFKDRCQEAVAEIYDADQKDLSVVSLFDKQLTDELVTLFDSVDTYLTEGTRNDAVKQTAFDDTDLVILDNNLAHLDFRGSRLTAESVAGYLRAFTAAPYIVSLNKNPDVDFDLRFLIGDYETRTDLAVNNRHLSNAALWSGRIADAEDGFVPWYWPALTVVPTKRRKQIAFVQDNLDKPVLDTFNFTNEAIQFLSRHARGALSPSARSDLAEDGDAPDIREVTFRHLFLSSSRSLPDKREREYLDQEQRRGKAEIGEVIARVVAAEVDRWFRLDVVGPQEALVDIPHLLMRMPFLLGDKASDEEAWNRSTAADATPFGMDQALFEKIVSGGYFHDDIWVLRPSFWWSNLRDNEELNKLFLASSIQWSDVVFCEDTSTFRPRDPKGENPPREFVAEFEGPWDRRCVAHLRDYKYAPRSRLAL
jgi:hypothetical protein